MSPPIRQPRLLAFSAVPELLLAANLQETIRAEMQGMKQLLGEGLIAVSPAASPAELLFFKACVDLRIPVIVLASSDGPQPADTRHQALSKALLSVALARYTTPVTHTRPISTYLLEWADVLLLTDSAPSSGVILEDALAIGIPTRTLSPALWRIPFAPDTSARHGFDSRRDLLDFLDLRFAGRTE